MPSLTDQQRQFLRGNAFMDNPDKSYAEGLAAQPGGGIMPEYQNDQFKIPGADLPSTNPLAKSMYDSQLKAAGNLSKNFQNYSDSAYNPVANQTRADLTAGKRSIRNGFNARGLLHSGGEVGAEDAATNKATSYLRGVRGNINQGLSNDITGLQNNAFSAAAGLAQPGPQTAQIYQQGVGSDIASQMSDAAAASSAYGAIGQGLGAIGGAGLASAMRGQAAPAPYSGNDFSYDYSGVTPGSVPQTAGMMRPGMTSRYGVTQPDWSGM